MIVGEKEPGFLIIRVVFANGAPLAFGEIGAPALPVGVTVASLLESCVFCGGVVIVVRTHSDCWFLSHSK